MNTNRGRPVDHPITIIVRHPRENPKKCSVLPLEGGRTCGFCRTR